MGGQPMAPAMAAAGGNPILKYVAIGCGALFLLSCMASTAWWAVVTFLMPH